MRNVTVLDEVIHSVNLSMSLQMQLSTLVHFDTPFALLLSSSPFFLLREQTQGIQCIDMNDVA